MTTERDADYANLQRTIAELQVENERLRVALTPLVVIANAYDDNSLDDEARKRWGPSMEFENTRAPEGIELYSGRGGRKLLTLADCFNARKLTEVPL